MRIFCTLLLITSIVAVEAQSPFVGNWSGKLQVGVSMRLVFHIKDSTGIHATMDSPDQNAFGFKADNAVIHGDSITMLFNRIRGKYRALLQIENNKPQLKGTWYQGGMELPLNMERGEAPPPLRPQTPKPPFDYDVEDVVYTNADKSVTLGATLTKPNGSGKFPVIILITGSGQQDRDETILGHKPFWVIADHLTKHGFAVLRVDDRGMGKSTGMSPDVTSQDFADDVIASINYLKTRTDIDVKKIGLLGHSEGGMIAPMVAAKTKDVAFMILLAGPAVKGIEVINEQQVAIQKASGMNEAVIRELDLASRKLRQIVVKAKTKEDAVAQVDVLLTTWLSTASDAAKAVLAVSSDEKKRKFVESTVNQLYSPWYRYFLQYDPAPALEKSNCPVLAIFGEKDLQVLSSQNMEPMKRILAKSRKPANFSVVEIRGANHLFQTCKACTIPEYGELTETISEETLTVISDWLRQTVVNK